MKETGIARSLDELGRVVLPIEIRKKLGWDIRDSLSIAVDEQDGKVMLTLGGKWNGPKCVFCGKAEAAITINGKDACRDCVDKILSNG